MVDRNRVRINLTQGEIEIEGTEAFLAEFRPHIDAMIERLHEVEPGDTAIVAPISTETQPHTMTRPELPSFGEYLHLMPDGATEVDRMLAAGYFLQRSSNDDSFTTGDANKRLAEHGIKIGNPSQCVRQSISARRAFSVARGRFRVSRQGQTYLSQLTNGALPVDP